jgi:hypothetical protein
VAKQKGPIDAALVELARQAVARVCTRSELQEEWDENPDAADRKQQAQDLQKRLQG